MSLVENLAAFFQDKPNEWIDGRRLSFAGSYAWRTRVSNLRKPPFNMTIENRVRRIDDGTDQFTISEYRYVVDEFKLTAPNVTPLPRDVTP